MASSRELIGEACDVGRYAARVRKIVRGNQSDLDLLILPVLICSLRTPAAIGSYLVTGLLLRISNAAELPRGEVILGVHLSARK